MNTHSAPTITLKCEEPLYLCAIKDVYSGRIVGYSIDSRIRPRSP
jgi:transposase InsO family protein